MSDGAATRTRPSTGALVLAMVGVVLACWLLLVPQGGQPDEHSHIVRSAALVRGAEEVAENTYVVPIDHLIPDPGCYAFSPTTPATCASLDRPDVDEVPLMTFATDYPPGAHIVFGAAGALPGLEPLWWGRLAAATAACALVGGALVAAGRRSRLLAAGLLLGLTPMAWSIITALNPSAFVTAGAAALWVGLLVGDAPASMARDARVLTVAGWVAMAVSRRDGLLWACIILAVIAVAQRRTLTSIANSIGRIGQVLVGASVLVVFAWSLTSESTTSRFAFVAPLALVALELGRRLVARSGVAARPMRGVVRAGLAVASIVIGAVVWFAVVSTRSGGWSTDLAIRIVEQTDDNLIEAIGVLGWLDTAVPMPVVFVWLLAVGALAWAAQRGERLDAPRLRAAALALVAITVSSAWTLELLQGSDTGMYWQGRYSLPLLIGLPLLLALAADGRGRPASQLSVWLVLAGLGSLNVAAWAAARRWGVGTLGSRVPWNWDTPIQPVDPLLLLIVHAIATAVLAAALLGWRPTRPGGLAELQR